MKVSELIELLKKEDPNALVIKSGYEGGYDEIETVETKGIKLNVEPPWYYCGDHDDAEDGEDPDCIAVYIR